MFAQAIRTIVLVAGLLTGIVAVPTTATAEEATTSTSNFLYGYTYLKDAPHRSECTAEPTCLRPSAYNRADVSSSWYREFAPGSITEVCLALTFRRNLVDPGEQVDISFGKDVPPMGFVNNGITAIKSRTLCVNSADAPEITTRFEDGAQNLVVYAFRCGNSFRLTSVAVSLTFYE